MAFFVLFSSIDSETKTSANKRKGHNKEKEREIERERERKLNTKFKKSFFKLIIVHLTFSS